MKYDLSKLMKKAWELIRAGLTRSAALTTAWNLAKAEINRVLSTEEKIEKLIKAGAKRWTKNGMDRLYINAKVLGLEYQTYKTGNVSYAEFNGEHISNCECNRILAAKSYINVKDFRIHCDYSPLTQSVEAFVASALNK